MAHLAIHQGRFKNAHFLHVPQHMRFGQAPCGMERGAQARNGIRATSGQRATQPIEHASLAFVAYLRWQALVKKARCESTKISANAHIQVGGAVG